MTTARFLARHRLRHGALYQRVYRQRNVVSHGPVVVYGNCNELPYPRLGLSVSRRVGNAVARNRWKRLVREAFRLELARLPQGIDLVVVAKGPQPPELSVLRETLVRLAAKLARRLAKEAP
ncbi:MAG: ribonuclease P protein component [Pirellulales bacterium]|nr:ribonuclease P protein component [Pirellulales bacterium]